MREIKFRAWSKYSNEMLSPHDLWKCGFYLCPSNGTFNAYGCDPDEPNNSDLDSWGENENLIPMQFTGLKDKNGKEIYEGDIINGLVVTYLGDSNAGLGMNAGWYLQRDDFESWVELECRCNENENNYEIIGNIYENPELLNG